MLKQDLSLGTPTAADCVPLAELLNLIAVCPTEGVVGFIGHTHFTGHTRCIDATYTMHLSTYRSKQSQHCVHTHTHTHTHA